MYIWIGLSVEEELKSLKKKCKEIESRIQFKESNITLPLHISLRISFLVEPKDYPVVLEDIRFFLKKIKPLTVKPKAYELHETICWLKMEENILLSECHKEVCQLLKEKYAIELHEYDKCFTYHTTLFLDSDMVKVKDAFMMIKDTEIPEEIKITKAYIGTSPMGKIGTYKIIEEIELGE